MNEIYLLWGWCLYESAVLLGVYTSFELAQEALNAEGKLKPQSGGYGGYDRYQIEPFPVNQTLPVKHRIGSIHPFPPMPYDGYSKDTPKRKELLRHKAKPYSLIA